MICLIGASVKAGKWAKPTLSESVIRSRSGGSSSVSKSQGVSCGAHGLPRPLVGADQHGLTLLAQVQLAAEIECSDELATVVGRVVCHDLGHGIRHQVLMLHRQHGQLETDHAPHFARPQTASVDDVLGVDDSGLGDDVPRRVRTLHQIGDHRVKADLGARLLRCPGVGFGHSHGVDVAFERIVDRADEVRRVHHGEQTLGLGHRNELGLHSQVPAAPVNHLQPVESLLTVGQNHTTGEVQAAVLPRDLLDLAIKLDGVFLQAGDVRVAVQGVERAGSVPGRSGRQLPPFEQDYIGPPSLREVVQHAAPDHATTDHDHLSCVLHY